MAYTPKPHVSAALRHLRRAVTVSGALLSIALILQMLSFAFVHFTDARWSTLQAPQPATHEMRVVRTNADAALSLSGAGSKVKKTAAAGTPPPPSANVNRVLNRNDFWLRSVSDLSRSVGSVAVIVLALAMFQGVVVAGGASVPGVEKAVTAGSWSIVIAFLCLPVATLLPGIEFVGALTSYDWMTNASEAVRSGSPDAPGWGTLYGSVLIGPMIALFATALVVLRFHAGVEQGVIVTNISELDEKLQREMSSIKLGATSAPRSVGALNRAIGEAATVAPIPTPPMETPLSGPSMRRLNEPNAGEGLKRPI